METSSMIAGTKSLLLFLPNRNIVNYFFTNRLTTLNGVILNIALRMIKYAITKIDLYSNDIIILSTLIKEFVMNAKIINNSTDIMLLILFTLKPTKYFEAYNVTKYITMFAIAAAQIPIFGKKITLIKTLSPAHMILIAAHVFVFDSAVNMVEYMQLMALKITPNVSAGTYWYASK